MIHSMCLRFARQNAVAEGNDPMRVLVLQISAVSLCCVFLLCLPPVEAAPADLTFVVDDSDDGVDNIIGDGVCGTLDNKCTLRAAIQEANARYAAFGGHYTVTLPSAGFFGRAYLLTIPNGSGDEDNAASGDLDIKSNLVLKGTGLVPPSIDASALNDRVFELINNTGAPIDVSMSFVRMFGGQVAGNGGGILSSIQGTLTLNSVTVMSNTVTTIGGGGGIASLAGTLVLNYTTVSGNAVLYPSAGGGINAIGPVVLNGSAIVGNSLTAIGPSAQVGFGGGALVSGGPFVISNSSILSNTVLVSRTILLSPSLAFGGGLVLNGGAVTLTNSTVRGNVVSSRNGGTSRSEGGGIYSLGANVHMLNTTVSANQVLYITFDGLGGGLYASQGTLLVERSLFDQNSAAAGGGLYLDGPDATVADSTVRKNTVNYHGGGIHNQGILRVRASTLNDNVAALTLAQGAGIYNAGTLSLTNSTLVRNEAGGDGGGLFTRGSAHVDSSTIVNNEADGDPGGVGNGDGSGDGGGIFVYSGTTYLRNSLLQNNHDFSVAPPPSHNYHDCAGILNSLDYNLISSVNGCTLNGTNTHNRLNQSTPLGPLQTNGGSTQTMALLAGGVAINGGNPGGCQDESGSPLTTDQRGKRRVGPCDIGAYEYMLEALLPLIRR